jgi:hypothetical protein
VGKLHATEGQTGCEQSGLEDSTFHAYFLVVDDEGALRRGTGELGITARMPAVMKSINKDAASGAQTAFWPRESVGARWSVMWCSNAPSENW